MARSYPNSDTIQPRYAAWLGANGLEISQDGINRARVFGNWTFMEFIQRARSEAKKQGVLSSQGHVANQDAFTEICWQVAFSECLHRFPA